jgi:hypothetical protein
VQTTKVSGGPHVARLCDKLGSVRTCFTCVPCDKVKGEIPFLTQSPVSSRESCGATQIISTHEVTVPIAGFAGLQDAGQVHRVQAEFPSLGHRSTSCMPAASFFLVLLLNRCQCPPVKLLPAPIFSFISPDSPPPFCCGFWNHRLMREFIGMGE